MALVRLRGEVGGVTASFALNEGDNLVGSRLGGDLALPERGVSRRHALVRVEGETVTVRDLGSKNGTFVNGERIASASVEPGDEVRFGSITLRLEEVEADDSRLAVVLDGGDSPSGFAATTRTGEAPPETVGVAWIAAIEALARELPERGEGSPSTALRAFATAAGVDACLVEWNGQGQPALLGACGAPSLLDALPRLSDAFAAAVDRTEASTCSRGDSIVVAVVAGLPRPLGVVLSGAPLPAGALAAARAVAVMLARSLGAPPVEEGRGLPGLVFPPGHVPGTSPAMRALYRQMRPLVQGDIPVLVVGETGVGKEHVARTLHLSSARARGPFVALNCAAIPAELLEAELFGIERAVATGVAEREGKLQQAEGGMLFLDEIGDMAPSLQAKLLRALQEREVVPLGGRRPVPIDVGLVSATNCDPEQLVAAGRIRQDLYYRIAGYVLKVPPLRDRREDIPALVEHLIARFATEAGKTVRGVTVRALEALLAHAWPGNVRQLEHEARRLVYLCPHGQAIDSTLIPSRIVSGKLAIARENEDLDLERRLGALERELVVRALERTGGNRTQAAALLGVSRNGLALKLERLGIAPAASAE